MEEGTRFERQHTQFKSNNSNKIQKCQQLKQIAVKHNKLPKEKKNGEWNRTQEKRLQWQHKKWTVSSTVAWVFGCMANVLVLAKNKSKIGSRKINRRPMSFLMGVFGNLSHILLVYTTASINTHERWQWIGQIRTENINISFVYLTNSTKRFIK